MVLRPPDMEVDHRTSGGLGSTLQHHGSSTKVRNTMSTTTNHLDARTYSWCEIPRAVSNVRFNVLPDMPPLPLPLNVSLADAAFHRDLVVVPSPAISVRSTNKKVAVHVRVDVP